MVVASPEPLIYSISSLGYNLYAMKMYWAAVSALWFYEYCLTLPDEVQYAWKGAKSPVFWLFILNRYLCPVFIIITLIAYFLDSWTLDVLVSRIHLWKRRPYTLFIRCSRYGFMETLETAVMTCIAEVFLTLRVYALLSKRKEVLYVSGIIILWQWAIALYAMSQSSKGTDQPALLLSRGVIPNLPTLPDTDPYHICIFISTLTVTPWVEAYLCLCLAFDGLAFLGIVYGVVKRDSQIYAFKSARLLNVIKRDGIMYFFVLFSSNLLWLLLLLHAPLGLKFIHNQPAMVISAIMINRITLNLKKESEKQAIITWSTRTFEHIATPNYKPGTKEEIALNDMVPQSGFVPGLNSTNAVGNRDFSF